jgi:hypothetical protein
MDAYRFSQQFRKMMKLAVVLLFMTAGIAIACPIGIQGTSDPNAMVCAKDANGTTWCDRADGSGNFDIIGAGGPSTGTGCLPAHGTFFVFDIACPKCGKNQNHFEGNGQNLPVDVKCCCGGSSRAGTAAFTAGNAGIFVTFSVPMPTAQYSVVVQPTNTAGYSPTADCTYFNVLKKTKTNFQVQHKRCDNGTPVNLDANVSLDWIAWCQN